MKYTITDVKGCVVKKGVHKLSLGANKIPVDIAEYPAGIYILNVSAPNFADQMKLVKE